jgi:hypothetical protein
MGEDIGVSLQMSRGERELHVSILPGRDGVGQFFSLYEFTFWMSRAVR